MDVKHHVFFMPSFPSISHFLVQGEEKKRKERTENHSFKSPSRFDTILLYHQRNQVIVNMMGGKDKKGFR